MIYSGLASPPKGATGIRALDTTSPRPSRSSESLFVVCVFVLIEVSLWFGGTEGGADAMRGSLQAQVLWGIVYFAAAIGLFRCRKNLGELVRRSFPIIAIIALASVSIMWSTDPGITLKRAIGLWGTSAFGYYVVSRFRLKEFVDVLGVTCYAIVILSLVAITLVPSVGVMHDSSAWRGIFAQKNILGEFMAISLLTFGTIIFSRSWPRSVAVVGVALSLALLVGSQSASALVICLLLLAGIGLTALYLRGARGRIIMLVVVASALLTLLGLVASGLDTQAILNALGRDDTLTGRTDLWPQVVQAISNRPWLGYGYSAFWLPNGDFTYFITSDWTPAHAHNGYLEACLDLGVVGATVAVLAILSGVRRGVALFDRHLAQCYAWPLLAVIYFLAVNLTESSIAKYNNFNWIVFIVAFLYASQAARELPAQGRPRIPSAEPTMGAVA